ncbi:MAG: GatB/YqeY domain-containing protein [Anaerolineae bacterium]
MSLKEQLTQEMYQAMKSHSVLLRDTLRLVITSIKYAEMEVGHPLDDAEVLDVIRRDAKRRRESIAEFSRGGRQDLVDQEQAELNILETYLPQQMGRAEIEALVRQAITELGVSGKAQSGLLMKHLMAQLKGRADGKLVSQVVQDLLK